MNNIRIALDVDDVLAAFCKHVASFFNKPLIKQDYWCVQIMDEYYGKGWFHKIAPIEEFWKTIPVLSDPKDINFPVHCYLSAFPEDMFNARVEWLRNHGFPDAPLICVSDKLQKCIELGITHLIDDKPATIQKLKDSPVQGIHFITDYAGFEPVGNFVTNLNQVRF